MDIKGLVEGLCKKYGTRDPFEISHRRNIVILFEPLGNIYGYYSKSHRQQVIHINNQLDERRQFTTCGHELGHSILHPSMNTPFLRAATMFSVEKFETQAHHFSLDLIYSDDELQECLTWPIENIAGWMGVPPRLAEYRMRSVKPHHPIEYYC